MTVSALLQGRKSPNGSSNTASASCASRAIFFESGVGITAGTIESGRERFVQRLQATCAKLLQAFQVAIIDEYANIAAVMALSEIPDQLAASEVTAFVDFGLCLRQRAFGQAPDTLDGFRNDTRGRFAGEQVEKANRSSPFKAPADELRQDAVLEQVAGVAHVVGQGRTTGTGHSIFLSREGPGGLRTERLRDSFGTRPQTAKPSPARNSRAAVLAVAAASGASGRAAQ